MIHDTFANTVLPSPESARIHANFWHTTSVCKPIPVRPSNTALLPTVPQATNTKTTSPSPSSPPKKLFRPWENTRDVSPPKPGPESPRNQIVPSNNNPCSAFTTFADIPSDPTVPYPETTTVPTLPVTHEAAFNLVHPSLGQHFHVPQVMFPMVPLLPAYPTSYVPLSTPGHGCGVPHAAHVHNGFPHATLPYYPPSNLDPESSSELELLATNMGKSTSGYRCIYCGKYYSRKYGLKIHLRTHTGFKPLKCKICNRAFGDPSNLNKHTRLHAADQRAQLKVTDCHSPTWSHSQQIHSPTESTSSSCSLTTSDSCSDTSNMYQTILPSPEDDLVDIDS